MKVSVDEFTSLLGISRRSLYYKEDGTNPWTLDEIITITEIMNQNGIEEHLTVSKDGYLYDICITKVSE